MDITILYTILLFCFHVSPGELGDMRQQMKTLEQKNEIYMQQTISLEEDSKRANTLKGQVELYKTQMSDLHTKMMEIEKKYDKAEYDAQRSKEKLLSIEAENEVRQCVIWAN